MKRLAILLLLAIYIGCKQKRDTPEVKISLAENNSALKITGLNAHVVKEIALDTAAQWPTLFAIYKMPADTDLKDYQPLQPGHYLVKDSAVTFTPDTPFAKQQTYFMRYYRYGDNNSVWDFVRGKKSPGKLPYTDLIFKP